MTPLESDLDPIINVPTRQRIVVALATLPAGDSLSFARRSPHEVKA
jgi:hypothetical protein